MRSLVAALLTRCLLGCMLSVGILGAPAAYAAGDEGNDKLDMGHFSCAQATALRTADPTRYEALALWVAGWRAEPKVDTRLSFAAIKAAGERWAATCGERPQIPFAEAVAAVTTDEMKGTDTIPLAAFKCQNFLDLYGEDEKAALAMIRWLDGWNASALGQTSINFYYHKKQMGSAVDGCQKYSKKALMYVTAGKYR